jgi:hypothetical protein
MSKFKVKYGNASCLVRAMTPLDFLEYDMYHYAVRAHWNVPLARSRGTPFLGPARGPEARKLFFV